MKFAEVVLTTPGIVEELIQNFRTGRGYLIDWLDAHGYSHKGEAGSLIFIKPKTDAQKNVVRMKAEKRITDT